ncbi:DUF1003 domain-containing protein [Algoriphagus sp. A40]|uniref:DUF1003 domain-containing protein n=1 Tax=Algoriphagus sp. A40 TaxID=1945863 RepID=UPI000985122A|nr:DUF1003 domain-containing protein [Algoriphagus sp. A40]OOG77119.1 hypothetical protein B0E43_05840 [Algoriphagus sp. A40]
MKTSFISNKPISKGESIQGAEIRAVIFELIRKDYPGFSAESYISLDELNLYRRLYLTQLMELERGELALLDRDVLKAIRENSVMTEKIDDGVEHQLTLGERMADRIATFGGSWTFIIVFFSFIILWMLTNAYILMSRAFDPFPFILLNLILSCLAAIQAPIIMMSQNRQESKDRLRAEHDYKINLKAELEIKLLSEKIDHLLVHQNKKLLEIQEVQVDYLEDLLKKMNEKNS